MPQHTFREMPSGYRCVGGRVTNGGTDIGQCPLCDGTGCYTSPCKICGTPNDLGELCEECATGNDPFVVAENCGKDLR